MLLSGVVAVLAAAYTAYWYSAVEQVRSGIARWADERRASGWQVYLGEPDIGGFPLRIDVLLQTPRLAGPGKRWRWTAPNVRAFAAPWALGRVSVVSPGIHVVSNRHGDYRLAFDEAEADLSVDVTSLSNAVVRLAGIDIRPPDGARLQVERAVLRGQGPVVVVDDDALNTEAGFGLAIDAHDVSLPAEWRPVLGREMARLSVDAVLTGTVAPGATLVDTLSRWRDGGGVVEIRAFALDWQDLSLRADGTFSLDRNLQPEGAMTSVIQGIDPTSDRLVAAGIIDPRAAFAARVANQALSFRGGSAKLPLSIQNQRLFVGPVPVMRLKSVRWDRLNAG